MKSEETQRVSFAFYPKYNVMVSMDVINANFNIDFIEK